MCHSKSGEINPVKVGNLVKAYVDKYKHARKHKKGEDSGKEQEVHNEAMKTSDSPWGGMNYRQGQPLPSQTLICMLCHTMFYLVFYHWVWSQTLWHETVNRDLLTVSRWNIFSNVKLSILTECLGQMFCCWSLKQHLLVSCAWTVTAKNWCFCVVKLSNLIGDLEGCALKRQISNTLLCSGKSGSFLRRHIIRRKQHGFYVLYGFFDLWEGGGIYQCYQG